MGPLSKTLLIITVTSILVAAALSGLHVADATNNLQVMLKTRGDFLIEWFEVSYQVFPTVRTLYTIRLNTLEEDHPFINVDIRFDETMYDIVKPTFDQAELMIWSGSFSLENGSSKIIHFSSSESYYYQFTPRIHNPYGNYSSQYLCSYSFNLSQSIEEAKIFFASVTGYSTAEQSNFECMIQFITTGLVQGITEGGQERQLRFDFVCESHEVEHFSFRLSIPDDFDFIDKQTLNDEEMYKTPNYVWGVDQNDRGYDSLGNPFWMCTAVVNWRVPRALAILETHPVDWILSALIGFFISSSLIYIRNILRKPKLSVNIATKPWVHPQTGIAFYRLIVNNKGKTTAHDCDIHITFRDSNQSKLFSLNGKWDRLPEPLGPIQAGGFSSVWPALIPYTETLSIRPGDSETFCLMLKDSEDPCYAYNARSYLHNYKNPQWQLPVGEYLVDVDIKSENARKHERFRIRNNGSNIQDVVISKLI